MPDIKLAMLISGGGTTAESIINAVHEGRLQGVEPVCVIASRKDAGGIEKAHNAGIDLKNILVIEPKKFEAPEQFGEEILNSLRERNVDFVGQYGWLCKTPENVIKEYDGRIVNQHPGPLDLGRLDFGGPGMYGIRVHAARLYFVRKTNRDFTTEATTHWVTPEFDKGAIVKRKLLDILPDDTPFTLQQRLLPLEWETQIEALQDFVNGTIAVYKRETPLVLESEEPTLNEAKLMAKLLFPKG